MYVSHVPKGQVVLVSYMTLLSPKDMEHLKLLAILMSKGFYPIHQKKFTPECFETAARELWF